MTSKPNGKPTSKFAAVLAAKNGASGEETGEVSSLIQTALKNDSAAKHRMMPTNPRRVGRPNAKRSDPDFVQTTAYVRKQTHRAVKIALLVEGQEREYSELIESLLADWLKSKR